VHLVFLCHHCLIHSWDRSCSAYSTEEYTAFGPRLIAARKGPGGSQPLQAAQPFAHDRPGQPAPLMIWQGAHRLKVVGAGHVIVPSGREGDNLAIRGDSHDVQVAAVERAVLDVEVPRPALIAVVWGIRVKGLPRGPASGRQLVHVAQSAHRVAGRDGRIGDGCIQVSPQHKWYVGYFLAVEHYRGLDMLDDHL